MKPSRPVKLRAEIERWSLIEPFSITGHTWEVAELLSVSLERDGCVGRGEAAGVYYKETPAAMIQQIESVRSAIEVGATRQELQTLLPLGGARNAVDCAMWDLEAQLAARPVWQLAGLEEPKPLRSTFTCGADTPDRMAAAARSYYNIEAIKIKLTGEPVDVERVQAVRPEGLAMARAVRELGLEPMVGCMMSTSLGMAPAFLLGQLCSVIDLDGPITLRTDRDSPVRYVNGLMSCPEALWGYPSK